MRGGLRRRPPGRYLGRMAGCDVVVVGGGVIGCAVAFELACEGASVVLVERDEIGAHASGAAAGMLAPIAESSGSGPLVDLGLRSLDRIARRLPELEELSGIDPKLLRCGVLRLAPPGEVEDLRAAAGALAGHACEWLDPDELHKREPRLAEEWGGALWAAREACLDPLSLTRAYAVSAERRGADVRPGTAARGVIRDGERVAGIRTDAGDIPAGDVVLCAGVWSGPIGAALGRDFPIEPVKGQILELEAPEPTLPAILWTPDVYLVPRPDGSLRVGATVERAGFDARPTAGAVAALLEAACGVLPPLSECRFERAWAGLRPATPDRLPLVGRVAGRPGLWIAAGHYRNGILLSALTAECLAAELVRGEAPPELKALDPSRFASAAATRT